jgi:hypothetical protein
MRAFPRIASSVSIAGALADDEGNRAPVRVAIARLRGGRGDVNFVLELVSILQVA